MNLARKLAALTLVALTFVSSLTLQVSPHGVRVMHAEAGLFKKAAEFVVAKTLIKYAAKGLTAEAKKKITAELVKRGSNASYTPSIIRQLNKLKAEDPAIARKVDDIVAFIRSEVPKPPKGIYKAKPVQPSIPNGNKFWNKSQDVGGTRVYQRDDLIDPNSMHKGLSNSERMANGNAPVSPNGKEIELHHMLQKDGKAMAEVTDEFHQKYFDQLHINPRDQSSGINRQAYDKWRKAYWMLRGKQF